MDLALKQRGRALVDFEVSIRQAANRLHLEVEKELAGQGINAETLPEDMEARHTVIENALATSRTYGARHMFSEWCAKNSHLAAIEAFEQIRDEVTPQLDALTQGPTTLEAPPEFEAPDYFSKVWFHRSHGGWDATDYNGFIHAEITHRKYVAKIFPGDIYAERRRIVDLAPRRDYKRILDIGASSGHYTRVLAEYFPEAQIWGLDPSKSMLEQAQRVANELGYSWKLVVGLGEAAPFPDQSFDLVTSYAVHHELPPRVIAQIFKEAYRLLEPGGDLLISDVARTQSWDRMKAWAFDWVARWVGEPYWRAAGVMDFAEGAREASFVDVDSGALEPQKTYWVRARKPS
jgi:SAM-dependent methyltransferase